MNDTDRAITLCRDVKAATAGGVDVDAMLLYRLAR